MEFKFKFENELINELVVRWITEHFQDPECRAVIDAHLAAINSATQPAIDVYENALRILWVIKPWQGAGLVNRLVPA